MKTWIGALAIATYLKLCRNEQLDNQLTNHSVNQQNTFITEIQKSLLPQN